MLRADSEFRGLISTKSTSDVLDVFDEVMRRLQEVNPTLYRSALDRLCAM